MNKRELLKLIQFSSLSESGFIPTEFLLEFLFVLNGQFSSLSESGFIPTILDLLEGTFERLGFSSLSESGFIPTKKEWKTDLKY